MAGRSLKAAIHAAPGADLHLRWGGAFAAGLRTHGWDARLIGTRDDPEGADLVAVWGVRNETVINRAKAIGATVVILECGYIGDRTEQISLSIGGGLNGRGRFGRARDNGERFARQWGHLVRPWHGGKVGLICGQVPADMSVANCRDLPGFYRNAADALRGAGFDPRFRPHPKARGERPGVPFASPAPLGEQLAEAGVVVVWNSNSAVDAILAGTPVICADEGCMAWGVAGHWPSMDILTPDRSEWFRDLAWKQWSEAEIRDGLAWDVLRDAA